MTRHYIASTETASRCGCSETSGPVNGSPAVAGDRTFVAGCDSVLHIIDRTKGTELNSVDLGGQAAATAAVFGDKLYVGTMADEVHEVDWKNAALGWTFSPTKRAEPFFASAAVTDSIVVVGSRDKRIRGLDRKTGAEVWTFLTEADVDASPVVVGDRVYAGSLDGKLYVLDLAKGTEVTHYELDSGVSGSPAVAAGRLLVGTEKGTLYCFGAKK